MHYSLVKMVVLRSFDTVINWIITSFSETLYIGEHSRYI